MSRPSRQRRVAVVGAGLTGLTAGWHLQKQGCRVQLFERSAWPGGRTRTVRRDGFVFDVGAITLLPTYRETCRLVSELGIDRHLHRVEPVIGIPRAGRMHRLEVARPIRSLLATDLIPWSSKLRLLKLLVPLKRVWGRANYQSLTPLAEWDGETIAERLIRDTDPRVLDRIAGPIIRGNTLNGTESAPFGELLWMLRQYAAPYLYGFDQGIDFLATTLAKRMPVAVQTTIERVERDGGGGVVLHGRNADGSFSERFDACVLALPPKPLLALAPNLTERQRLFLDGVKPLPSVNVHLGLRRRPEATETFILPPESEQPVLTTIVMDHLKAPGRAPDGKGVVSLFCRDTWSARHMERTDQEIVDQMLRMAAPFTGIRPADVETAVVQRWPYAIIKSEPGLYRRMLGYEQDLDPTDPVQIAGDFLSMGMEAAISAGKRAASTLAGQAPATATGSCAGHRGA